MYLGSPESSRKPGGVQARLNPGVQVVPSRKHPVSLPLALVACKIGAILQTRDPLYNSSES